ncbi:hypothetical protein M8C21_026724 [Ambrosia artemisiifolia]|uniref:Protein kinase domain-containing protein n=1 Tax=Ambrosia artemisiifolia TaxID=4212 RepID=A0AAD5GV85_AMBAR|nr:hypothetical protein M8C21_026724 [Ambrosia artemisiifolia]
MDYLKKKFKAIVEVQITLILLNHGYISLLFSHHPHCIYFDSIDTNIAYSGDAEFSFSNGAIRFNTVNYLTRVGHIKYAHPVQIWDKISGNLSDFTTNFSMHSGTIIDARLSYRSTTKILKLIWSYGADSTTLSYHVDLRKVVPEWVTVGFSAATGKYIEEHILQYWEFDSSFSTKEEKKDNSNKLKLTVGLTLPLALIIIGGIITCTRFCIRRRKTMQQSLDAVSSTLINDDLQRGAAKRYSYSELILATNNFSDDLRLGQGGFGSVYKGYLPSEAMTVAVKNISQSSKQGKKEYMAEVKINGNLIRHRNLVPLIGWCHSETQFLLVYEYMPNGSLDSHLFGTKSPLKWSVRYKIAKGLASALLYLHEDLERCVVHRDIKTSNVMLDSGFNVKLGDFGLARLMEKDIGPQTTVLAGTLGYMAPEYISTGKASKESDVYSFGVVALEIACGRRVRDGRCNSNGSLVQWVWDLHAKGELLSGVDAVLGTEFDAEQVECLMTVGLWCAHPDCSMRPSIRQAIQVLNFEGALPNLPMKMPVAMYTAGPYACVEPQSPTLAPPAASIFSWKLIELSSPQLITNASFPFATLKSVYGPNSSQFTVHQNKPVSAMCQTVHAVELAGTLAQVESASFYNYPSNLNDEYITETVKGFSFMFIPIFERTHACNKVYNIIKIWTNQTLGFEIPPNSAAGFLGLFNRTDTGSSRNQIIFVEFDTFSNVEWDPAFGHVGINENSLRSANYTAWNASMHSGDPIDAWVSYNSTTNILKLTYSYGAGNTSDLSYHVDLREVVPEWVTIGFSAATGNYVEKHMVQYWEFNSSLSTGKTSEDNNSNNWKLTVGLTVPLAVMFIVGMIICTGICIRRRRISQESLETVSLTSINDDLESGVAKRFSYSDLASATNNFSDDRKLGEGGFGSVYKGYLPCISMAVAVKKNISQASKQGRKEYMTEVKINSRLRHRNLVQLVGWCHDENQFLLVYEYMPNGSLDAHLFGKKSPLKWPVRYKIAVGLASALLYLHEEWEQCVWAWDLHGKGELLSGVDPLLGSEFDAEQVECLMMVGLWCAHPDWTMRPSIRQAIQFEGALPILPVKMPVAMYYSGPDASEGSSAGATFTNTSVNLER